MKRMGVSEMRGLNAKFLRELTEPVEICDRNHKPLRVLIPYAQYMDMQDEFVKMEQLERAALTPEPKETARPVQNGKS